MKRASMQMPFAILEGGLFGFGVASAKAYKPVFL